MFKIAVTGGVASGKTSVCRILETQCNAFVVSSDKIVHELLQSDTNVVHEVVKLLGPHILDDKGSIDRSKVADVVFNNFDLLYKLESLLHPEVVKKIKSSYEQIKTSKKYSIFVAEVPLLFETHLESSFDITIAIIADEEKCLDRFLCKKGSPEEYKLRSKRQLPMREKAKKAHVIINNCGSMEDLTLQVYHLSPNFTSI